MFKVENKYIYHLILFAIFIVMAISLFVPYVEESSIFFITVLPILGHRLLKMNGIVVTLVYSFLLILLYVHLNIHYGTLDVSNMLIDVTTFSNFLVLASITFVASVLSVMAQEKMSREITKTSKENYAMEGLLGVVGTCYTDDIERINRSVKDILKNSKSYNVPQSEKEVINNFKRATSQLTEVVTQVNCIKDIDNIVVENRAVTLKSIDIIDRVDFTFYGRLKVKNLQFIGTSDFETTLLKTNISILHNHILNNIISNAIKFSRDNGEIKMDVSLKDSDVVITISDNGVGIKKEGLAKVISFFDNYSNTGTEGELGTGFGVALAVYYTNLIGGVLSIQSKSLEEFPDDHGTVFTIKLPGGSSV